MTTHSRAEDLSDSEIFRIIEANSTCGPWYGIERLHEYFKKETNFPIVVSGPRGIGKTLLIRAALLTFKNATNVSFYIYKRNERFELLRGHDKESPDFLVVDDLHYVYDDIRFKGKDDIELVKILENGIDIASEGKKVIVAAEDVIAAYPLKNERFLKLLPKITLMSNATHDPRIHISRAELGSVCNSYGVDLLDETVRDFLERTYATPRNLVHLIELCAGELSFERFVEITKERLSSEKDFDAFLKTQMTRKTINALNATGIHYRKYLFDLISTENKNLDGTKLNEIAKKLWKKLGKLEHKTFPVTTNIKSMFKDRSEKYLARGLFYIFTPIQFALRPELTQEGYLKEIVTSVIEDDKRRLNSELKIRDQTSNL